MFSKKKSKVYTSAIIAAAGSGRRMGADINKIFLNLGDMPVLARTLLAFEKCDEIDEIILVCAESEIMDASQLAREYDISKLKCVCKGGATRKESVANGLREVSAKSEIILIHDAARPLILEDAICEVKKGVIDFGAAACGAQCKNTIKEIDDDEFIYKTPNRESLVEIQTPQGFLKDVILAAHKNAEENNIEATDDCMLAEIIGKKVKVIFSGSDNLKITTYDDLILAEQILKKRGE